MKRKGFTLVELLATIVIIAIIILLATSGFGAISKKVKEKAHENLVKYIETKAAEYASETGNLITNVDNLVKLGYVEADNEKGEVISPKDGSILNCHIVDIVKVDVNYYGKYTENIECNLENITIINQNLGVNAYKTSDNITKGEKIESGKWSNQNVILEAYLGNEIEAEEVTTIIWQSNIGHEQREVNGNFFSQNKYLVTAEQIVNTTYSVTIVLKNGLSYKTQTIVKIDKQRPIIHEVYIENEKEYTAYDKKITITASDGNGSGIYGYYIGESPNCKEVEYEENSNNTYETRKGEGKYYVCVKDKAGNVSEDISTESIEVKYIDKEPPKIVAKENPKTLGKDDYPFINNTMVTWGKSGEGEISCNPTVSKKTGVYDVTCTAIGKNGLSAIVTFIVNHHYPATFVRATWPTTVYSCCKNTGNCWEGPNDSINCVYACEGIGNRNECQSRKCEECPGGWTGYGSGWCDYFETWVDCSYYSCPQGGSPIGDTCYY